MKMKILVTIDYVSGTLNATEMMLHSVQLVSADSKGRVMHIGTLVVTEKEANLSIISTKSKKKQATLKLQITGIKEAENKDRIIDQIKESIQRMCDIGKTKVNLKVERMMTTKTY